MKEVWRDAIRGGVVAVAGAAGLLTIMMGPNKHDRTEILDSDRVEELADDDGFRVSTPYEHKNYQGIKETSKLSVEIDLGSCSLDDVEVVYQLNENGELIDLNAYEISGHAFAEQHEERQGGGLSGSRTETVTEGTEVTFTFENYQQLEQEVLGEQPCKTLASGNFIQG